MNLFKADSLNREGGHLGKEESHHAHRVLRLQPGAEILTTTGQGIIYRSEISEISKSACHFRNLEGYKEEPSPERKLHIAIAPTKSNERFEFFLEKATEVGISVITPIICQNSERKVYKTVRGEKIISAASKQSLACWWPVLNEPMPFAKLVSRGGEAHKLIAHCEEKTEAAHIREIADLSHVTLLIGPEGDFSPAEIELALKNGFRACSLGDKRLRTETAGIAVAVAFNL